MNLNYNLLKKIFICSVLSIGIALEVSAQTNVLVSDDAAVVPGTTASDGLFQINRNSSLGLDIINRSALGLNVISEMSFRTDATWTGSIKTIGLNATDARMAFFTGANGTRSNLVERFSINNDGNFALNFASGAGVLGYLNFGSVFGVNGFGIRCNGGTMEYRHNSGPIGVWTPFPPNAPLGTTVEWWLRLAAGFYIYPQMNTNIRIYDPGQTYGIYYDGATNQYGMYARTSSAMVPTSAVVGFSDVTGNQTYGYLGYNGPYYAHLYNGRAFSLSGMAVYGLVDDPWRTAVFARTTSNANTAALCSFSDCWISGFFEAKDSSLVWASRPTLYGQMTTKVDKAGNQSGIRGLSYYWETATASNLGATIGIEAIAQSNTQDGYGLFAYHNDGTNSDRQVLLAGHDVTNGYDFGLYAQGSTNEFVYLGVPANGMYGYCTGWLGAGYTSGAPSGATGVVGIVITNQYNFGVIGEVNSGGAINLNRSGGVLGSYYRSAAGPNAWGSLGYRISTNALCGVYGSTAYVTGGGKSTESSTGVGIAGYGDLFGSWFRGDIYGMAVKGERISLYVDGKTYTNDVITQMNDNGKNGRIPTYVPTSMTADIYMKGTAQLINGKAVINFDDKYLSLISEKDPIVITVTPMGKTNGVYIDEVKSSGFTIAENNDGKSNVTFSWIAIATRKGYENPENPVELLSSEYDKHLSDFMFNENDTLHSGKPMWWDGTKLRFDNQPEQPESMNNNLNNTQPLKTITRKNIGKPSFIEKNKNSINEFKLGPVSQ